MVKDGIMNIEQKKPCKKCKKSSNVTLNTQPYTKEEMDKAMTMIGKYGLTPQDQAWLVNLNNRVLKDNKTTGCGKCMIQVQKNLRNAYNRLYGQ
jgi:hypothetical protein